MSRVAKACLLLVCVLALAACAGSEPARFYTLDVQAPEAEPEPAVRPGSIRRNLALSPVQVPRYLDRPQLVTRAEANTLELAEFDKWSEPLSGMIGRVLAEDLSRRLPRDRIFQLPVRQALAIDRIVDIQVMRFDATAAGEVVLDARWQVFAEGGRRLLRAEQTVVQERAASAGKAATVAAMSRALSRLAAEIAEALSSDAAKDARGAERTDFGPARV